MELLTLVGLQIPQPIKLVIHYITTVPTTNYDNYSELRPADHQSDLLHIYWDDDEKFSAELPTASLQVDQLDFIPAAVEKLWADLLTY